MVYLLKIFSFIVEADGTPVVQRPNPAIPRALILSINQLIGDGMTEEDAIVHVRGKLVPDGYQVYPFKRNTPETFLHALRSLVGTYLY